MEESDGGGGFDYNNVLNNLGSLDPDQDLGRQISKISLLLIRELEGQEKPYQENYTLNFQYFADFFM